MGFYTTIASVHEEAGSRSEHGDVLGGKSGARVTLRVPYADTYNVIADIIGNRYPWPWGGGVNPARASAYNLRLPQGCGYTDNGDGSLTPEEVLIDIDYMTDDAEGGAVEASNGEVYSETLEPTMEFIKLNHTLFAWGSATGTPLTKEEAPGRQVRGCNIVRTWFDVETVPAAIFDLIGAVNETAYVSVVLGKTFAAETLLYMPPTMQTTLRADGTFTRNITTKFTYNPDGWNKYWRPDLPTPAFQSIYLIDPAQEYKNYPPRPFGGLLFT